MIELRDELYAAPTYEWRHVPITANRHKWWLHWYRSGGDRDFVCLTFESPRNRRYTYYIEQGKVTDADVALADGSMLASYWPSWGDSPARLDAVLRLTPKHVLDRLSLLLDAIG